MQTWDRGAQPGLTGHFVEAGRPFVQANRTRRLPRQGKVQPHLPIFRLHRPLPATRSWPVSGPWPQTAVYHPLTLSRPRVTGVNQTWQHRVRPRITMFGNQGSRCSISATPACADIFSTRDDGDDSVTNYPAPPESRQTFHHVQTLGAQTSLRLDEKQSGKTLRQLPESAHVIICLV